MAESKRQRKHKAKVKRVMVSIPDGLLEMVDQAAKEDYTTRSDIIRVALLWYLRPQGRDLAKTDPEVILKTLQHRNVHANMKKLIRELEN